MDNLFGAYAFHQQEIEDAIQLFLQGATAVEFDDDMSDEEIAYIRAEVARRSKGGR